MRQPLPGRLDVTGLQRAPDGTRLPGQRGRADDGPGGDAGQDDGGGGTTAYGAGGQARERDRAADAHGGVHGPAAPVVPPQHPLHGSRGPPERGDRMPVAGIAEEQVAQEAGGGAVREHAIGTHGFSR